MRIPGLTEDLKSAIRNPQSEILEVMAWIRTIREDVATGSLKDEYDKAVRRAGRVYEILKIQSLKPEYIATSIGLYQKAMFGPSKLTRAQREMMAVVVSATNHCHY